jgi:hypothetical protein
MTGAALQEHLARMAEGYTEKHSLMMQLANGKKRAEKHVEVFRLCKRHRSLASLSRYQRQSD